MDLTKFENFRGWIPVRGVWREKRAFVDWCYAGKERLSEPFFDDSILRLSRRPFNSLFRHRTPIEFLGELNEFSEGLKPNGFIFHLSRCGSTLLSQMLAAPAQNIVISEAAPIDFVLRAQNSGEEQRIEWLRWMINAFGQRRTGAEENFFIKFDSWNALQINLVRRAFPDVPWIFLYRNPVEIIVSHLSHRGAQMVPGVIGEILPELPVEEAFKLPPEEYFARVLAELSRAVLEPLQNGEGLAVDYTELPEAVNARILKHFGIELTGGELEKMSAASKFNAKNPRMQFSADSEKKKKEASAAAISAAEKFAKPFYEELELCAKTREIEQSI